MQEQVVAPLVPCCLLPRPAYDSLGCDSLLKDVLCENKYFDDFWFGCKDVKSEAACRAPYVLRRGVREPFPRIFKLPLLQLLVCSGASLCMAKVPKPPKKFRHFEVDRKIRGARWQLNLLAE